MLVLKLIQATTRNKFNYNEVGGVHSTANV